MARRRGQVDEKKSEAILDADAALSALGVRPRRRLEEAGS